MPKVSKYCVKQAFLMLFPLLLALSHSARAQDNACKLILQQGLYKYYNFSNSGSFDQDMKSYFTSETFRSDVHNSKWSSGLVAVIDGSPVKFNADSSDADITQFQQKVSQSSSFHLDQSFYAFASTAVPDAELAKVYSDCIANASQVGFHVFTTSTDNAAQFVVKYGKISSRDAMPKVRLFQARNNVAITCKESFHIGSVLTDATAIDCPRNPNYDLTFTLETDHGVESGRIPASPSGFNRDLPVGTVVTSALDWATFQAVTKNNDANPGGQFWTSKYSKWAPADGRDAPGSAWQRASSVLAVPDLRGVFVRGLNAFDPSESSHQSRDPDNRTVGSFQADDFSKHDHGGVAITTRLGFKMARSLNLEA